MSMISDLAEEFGAAKNKASILMGAYSFVGFYGPVFRDATADQLDVWTELAGHSLTQL